MSCEFRNCVTEVEIEKDVVPILQRLKTDVFDPRSNSVLFHGSKTDHPAGLGLKSTTEIGVLYFQWLPNKNFQKVRLHLCRELEAKDDAAAVDQWLKRKLDELWLTIESVTR